MKSVKKTITGRHQEVSVSSVNAIQEGPLVNNVIQKVVSASAENFSLDVSVTGVLGVMEVLNKVALSVSAIHKGQLI